MLLLFNSDILTSLILYQKLYPNIIIVQLLKNNIIIVILTIYLYNKF